MPAVTPVKNSLPRDPSSHRACISPSRHTQHRQGDLSWQGTHKGEMGSGDTATDSRREGAALRAPLNSLALWLLPLVWLLSCREVEGKCSPRPLRRQGWGQGKVPGPSPSPAPPLT